MNIKITCSKIFILQALIFLLIINSVAGEFEYVRGPVNYNIEIFGVTNVELQAPEIYTNQTFLVNATIRVNQSYSADVFNATIILPSGFTLPNNDENKSNPSLAGYGSLWITNWTVRGALIEGNYTINVTVLFFDSTAGENLTVYVEPDDFENGTVVIDAGGPYNFSDTGSILATVKDKNGNYTNIIGECNTTIYYPDASVFEENKTLNYLTGSHGIYYYNFTVPNTSGNYTANVNCTLPVASNTTIFEVVSVNQAPYFTNIFVITGSFIHRSDNNPIPTQDVDFWVHITDPNGDPLTVIMSYSIDGLQSFANKSMVYDVPTETWRTQIGNFVAQTTARYYVQVTDNSSLSNRTPETGYDTLIWDNPPDTSTGGGIIGDIIIPVPDKGKGEIDIVEFKIDISVEQGGIEFAIIKINNTGNDTLHNVFITLEGLDLSWYSIDPTKTDIEVGNIQSFVIKFNIPLDATVKKYPVNIRVDSDERVDRTQFIFEVTPSQPEVLLRIVDIEIPKLEPDRAGIIKILIENQHITDKNVSLDLNIPAGWLIDEAEQIKLVPAGEQVVFEFKIVPDKEGIFTFQLKGNYDIKYFSEDIIVNVQISQQPYDLLLYTPLIIIIIIFVIIIIILMRIIVIKDSKYKEALREQFIERIKKIYKSRKDKENIETVKKIYKYRKKKKNLGRIKKIYKYRKKKRKRK